MGRLQEIKICRNRQNRSDGVNVRDIEFITMLLDLSFEHLSSLLVSPTHLMAIDLSRRLVRLSEARGKFGKLMSAPVPASVRTVPASGSDVHDVMMMMFITIFAGD